MRSTFFAYDHIPVGLALWTLLVAVVVQPTTALDWNATKAVIFADDTWNCAGNAPPCHDCANRVSAGSSQDPYGCAPYVAHCLAAGGAVGLSRCGSIDEYSTYEHNGVTYDLNYVAKQDKSCGGLCLLDYLKAIGWRRATTVRAGTVCAVVGEDNGQPVPYGHVVFGVGDGIVNAHNMAHYHKSISDYSIDECVSYSGAIDERDDDAKIKTV